MEALNYLIEFFSNYGYLAVFFVLIACGFGLPVPEDITLVAGGVICGIAKVNGWLSPNPHTMVIVALSGVLLGDSIMFGLGYFLGDKVRTLPFIKWFFTERNYKSMQRKLDKHGNRLIFVARFLPGIRAFIFIVTGVSRSITYTRFLVLDGLAAIISVPTLTYLGFYLSQDLPHLFKVVKQSETIIFSILGVAIVAWLINSILKSRKKKRILSSRKLRQKN